MAFIIELNKLILKFQKKKKKRKKVKHFHGPLKVLWPLGSAYWGHILKGKF